MIRRTVDTDASLTIGSPADIFTSDVGVWKRMERKYVLNQRRIDKIEDLDMDTLTFEDIRKHYGTGQAIPHGSGRDKTYSYRHGVGTNVGDIKEDVWCEIVKRLIIRSGEHELFSSLRKWLMAEYPKKSRAEIANGALELHASRMFDDPQWADYIPFNLEFRPEVLAKTEFVTIICSCCEKPELVTKEQIEAAYENRVVCPICGRHSEYSII